MSATPAWSSLQLIPRTTVTAVTCLVLALPAAHRGTFPDTTENIHLALAFDYAIPNHDLTPLAGKIDYIWGASPGFTGTPVPSMHRYMPFNRDGAYDTLAWLQANHPDWIVYQCDQKTPAWASGNLHSAPIDINNPAVLAYQMQRASAFLSETVATGGYPTGIDWDNLAFTNGARRCGHFDLSGRWVPLYNGKGDASDPLYAAAVVSWAEMMSQYVRVHFPGKAIAMNFRFDDSHAAHSNAIVSSLDLNVFEGGFSHPANLTGGSWQSKVRWLESLNQQGKGLFIIEEIPAANDAAVTRPQLNWAIANYLLVKGRHSYMMDYCYNGVKQNYGGFPEHPEYYAPIGHPTSVRYADPSGAQRRDYSNGMALVNPSSARSCTVTLNGTYQDLYGSTMTSVTLGPASGVVLLKAAPPSLLPTRPSH